MQGDLSIQSAEGSGTVFSLHLTLPRNLETDERIESKENLAGIRTLIVDDNEVNRQILTEYLNKWKIPSDEAQSGHEALALLTKAREKQRPYEIALLDYHMPGMDGRELANRVKSDPGISTTILILLSSSAIRGDSDQLKTAGFSACLRKPIRSSDLLETLLRCWSIQQTGKPREDTPILEYQEKRSAREPTAKLDLNVLLVEDNRTNQMVANNYLESFGCTVDLAENGQEALDNFSQKHYDLILMDCSMPIMDGYDATREIRSRETKSDHIPIIAMTAHAMEGDMEKCLEAGMNDYLSKPVRKQNLKTILSKYAGLSSEEQSPSIETEDIAQPIVQSNSQDESSIENEEYVIFDYEPLLKDIDNDMEIMEEIVTVFLEDTPPGIEQIKAGLEANDIEQVRKAAHKIKGSAANLGGMQFSHLGSRIEQEAKQSNIDECWRLFQPLCLSFKQLENQLNRKEWRKE